jgi:hypothetical protein
MNHAMTHMKERMNNDPDVPGTSTIWVNL